jgi:hypothetical protein
MDYSVGIFVKFGCFDYVVVVVFGCVIRLGLGWVLLVYVMVGLEYLGFCLICFCICEFNVLENRENG